MKNPNAAVAGGGTSLSVLVVWLLGHFHVALSAEDGAVIAGALATVVLFIGREGIRGVWRRIWGGEQGAADTLLLLTVAILVAVVLILWKVW
jgi:hypothetical protein